MEHAGFFTLNEPVSISEIAERTGAELEDVSSADKIVTSINTLAAAQNNQLAFLDNKKYLPQLPSTKAGACFVKPVFAKKLSDDCTALLTKEPYRAHARALEIFYQEITPHMLGADYENINGAWVARSAHLEENVFLSPGAVVEPEARIGSGTHIHSGAVIGCRTMVGRGCAIHSNASVRHSLLGNGVIIHAGCVIGQDGFGFAMGQPEHKKVLQIGRVIIQDNVEIGATSTVDRGALQDTVIGEGTKIDNLVQIGHNVEIGRHCVIVSQTGVSGSAVLEDYVVLGGKVGVVGHVRVGQGAQIAATSGVTKDVPAGVIWGGAPAKPVRIWQRELAAIKMLAMKDMKK